MSGGHNPARSKEYSAIKARIFVANVALTVAALTVFQFFFSEPLSRMAFRISSNFYLACLVFASVFLCVMYIVSFPLHLFGSFFVERRFGLSRQSFKAWLADEVKSAVLSFGLLIVCVEAFYLILRSFPKNWWIVSAGAWVFFLIVLSRFLPVLIIPIFYRYLPIKESSLRERVMSLAGRAGIRLMDVCRIDFSRKTRKANAALVGLGKTRRVILTDTLTGGFTPGEVGAVVAHEFGHFRYRHTWQLLAFSGIITAAGFFTLFSVSEKIALLTGTTGLSDLRLFPVLVLLMTVFSFILLPLQNFFSRILERQADRFALSLTDEPEDFISVMRKLASMNLADQTPSWLQKVFLYNHPPISERIQMAEGYRRQKDRT